MLLQRAFACLSEVDNSIFKLARVARRQLARIRARESKSALAPDRSARARAMARASGRQRT